MKWPKDYVIITKSRPSTFAARMASKALEWGLKSSKRYSEEGAKRAFQTLHKQHRGADWGVFHVPTRSMTIYTKLREEDGN